MKTLTLFSACACCLLLFFAGVVREDVGQEKFLALGNQKQFNCVGQLFTGTGAHGSCVLVGKKYVLSAAHIFMSYVTRPDTMMLGGQQAIINVTVDAKPVNIKDYLVSFRDKVYRCKTLIVYPGYDWKKSGNDMVLIELEKEVTGIEPAHLNRSFNELGSIATGVGFGASGYGNDAMTVIKANQKIAGENTIDSIGGPMVNGQPSLLVCDFDAPGKPELNRIGKATPCNMEYTTTGGDSGGGMFRYVNKRWELIGITQSSQLDMKNILKNGYYGALMMWSRVAVFGDWIEGVVGGA